MEYDQYINLKMSKYSTVTLTTLGIYVPDAISEDSLFESIFFSNKYNPKLVTLTISLTSDCNFCCGYCFVNSESSYIKSTDCIYILNFVNKLLNVSCAKTLKLYWFGGEPLLNFQLIEELTPKLQSLCKNNNCLYTAELITNGSLLNQHFQSTLKALNIDRIQITLDGGKITHDNIRSIKTAGSYDQLLGYIRFNLNDMNIVIRINISRDTYESAFDALSDLKSLYINNMDRLHIDIARLINFKENNDNYFLSVKEFAKCQYRLIKYATEIGIPYNSFDIINSNVMLPCSALKPSTYVIDSKLNLHKCWNMIESSEGRVGYLKDNISIIDSMKTINNIVWNIYSPMKNVECIECRVFPLCLGGCPWSKIIAKKPAVCSPYKYNIEDIIRLKATIYERKFNAS